MVVGVVIDRVNHGCNRLLHVNAVRQKAGLALPTRPVYFPSLAGEVCGGTKMGKRRTLAYVLATAGLLGPSAALGQDLEPTPAPGGATRSAEAGMFLPFTLASRVDTQAAFVTTLSGYDSARKSALLEGATEIHLWGPIAVRAGAVYTDAANTLKPTFGLHVQALSQERHGVDASAAVVYKPEGFSEGEGEVEAIFTVGRRAGRLGMFANLVYGQDPEAAERDGEVRLAALYSLRERLQAGLDTRFRFDLGSDPGKRRAKLEADYDLIAGPTASLTLGPVALIGQAGVSAVRVTNLNVGAIALGGLGAAF